MSNPFEKTSRVVIAGAAVAASLAGVAQAQDNPFAMQEIAVPRLQLAEQKEMTCGEGKCGGALKNDHAAALNVPKANTAGVKGMEGKCGSNKPGAPAAPAATPAPAAPANSNSGK